MYRLLYTIVEVDGFFVRVQLDRVLFTFYPSYVIQSRCQIDPKKEYDVTAVSCRFSTCHSAKIHRNKQLVVYHGWEQDSC